jgi:hypothetical protein
VVGGEWRRLHLILDEVKGSYSASTSEVMIPLVVVVVDRSSSQKGFPMNPSRENESKSLRRIKLITCVWLSW